MKTDYPNQKIRLKKFNRVIFEGFGDISSTPPQFTLEGKAYFEGFILDDHFYTGVPVSFTGDYQSNGITISPVPNAIWEGSL